MAKGYNIDDPRNFAPIQSDGSQVSMIDETLDAFKVTLVGANGSTGATGTYNATAPTLTDKQTSSLQLDSSGNLKDTMATLIAGEDLANNVLKVEERFSYANIASATTTTVKSGAGFLHCLTINTTAAGAITIYDNTAGSGTKIATIAASPVIGSTFKFDVSFGTGLTIVTAAASDITVSYR